MAVLFVYDAKGNPADLMKRYRSAEKEFKNPKYHKGLIAHICVETPDGIQVLNLMEAAEPMHALLNDPTLGKVVDDAGLSSVNVSHSYRNYKVQEYYVKG